MVTKPLFTKEQLIDKALISIKLNGTFEIATIEWNRFDANNKNWHELRAHFSNAYDLWRCVGVGTAGMTCYYGVANVVEDNSL